MHLEFGFDSQSAAHTFPYSSTAEQRAVNSKVPGSNPGRSAKLEVILGGTKCTEIARLWSIGLMTLEGIAPRDHGEWVYQDLLSSPFCLEYWVRTSLQNLSC